MRPPNKREPASGKMGGLTKLDRIGLLIGTEHSRTPHRLQARHLRCRFKLPPELARLTAELCWGGYDHA